MARGKIDPQQRLAELTQRERALHKRGFTHVAGIDEAGRGPLAGPVVAACVVFEPGTWVPGVDDSKKLTARRRELLYDEILAHAKAVGVGIGSVALIDEINILEATRTASIRALKDLGMMPDFLFTDALSLPVDMPTEAVVRADAQIYCVAAASIVAKVTRDRMMLKLDAAYPAYDFASNKGYGTRAHCEAILSHGPTPQHRKKFLRKLLAGSSWGAVRNK